MQRFDHEKLDVYHKAIEFVAWAGELCELVPRGPSVRKQLDRASTSIPLNIAEGNGKHTMAEAVTGRRRKGLTPRYRVHDGRVD